MTIVLPCYNEQDHVIAEVERICAAMDASGYTYELRGRRRLLHRRDAGQAAGGRAAVPEHADRALPPQRRLRHRAPDRHPAGPGRDRRVDRRRHDLPERAHPRAGPDPGEGPDDRPGRRRADQRGGLAQAPPGAGQVVHPQGGRAADRARRSPTSTPGCGRSASQVALPYLRLLPPGLLLRHDDHAGVPVEPARRLLRADRLRQAGRQVEVPASSRTPTATSCRCCGW